MVKMFSLFSVAHFVYLIVAIGLVVGLFFILKRFHSDGEQKMVERILLGAMIFFLVLEYVGRILYLDDFNFWNNLPLNAFQVFVFVCIYSHFSRRLSWIKFGYLVMAPVSFVSMIFVPNIYTSMPMWSLSIICYMIILVLVISYSIISLLYTRYDLEHKDVLGSVINFIIIVAIAHIVNVILRFTAWGLQADYFGTMAEGYNLYIGWLSKLIPVPFVVMLPLFAIVFGLAYLVKIPFDVMKSRKEKQDQLEEIIALGNLKEQQKYREEQRQERKAKSQILVRSETKATPNDTKNVNNSSKESFVKTAKEVNVNNNRNNE